jgi:septum formation protein
MLAGYTFDCVAADIDESAFDEEDPIAMVEFLAGEKARVVSLNHPGKFIIGSDTIVVFENSESKNVVLGKPVDREDARTMLRMLAGKLHRVLTAYVIVNRQQDKIVSQVVSTSVWFRDISEPEIAHYVDSGDADDKAGAYGIQGFAGSFVERISGSYLNVVGLPLSQLIQDLDRLGVPRL